MPAWTEDLEVRRAAAQDAEEMKVHLLTLRSCSSLAATASLFLSIRRSPLTLPPRTLSSGLALPVRSPH